MDLVCGAGKIPDAAVATLTQSMMVAWGELMVGRRAKIPGDTSGSSDETVRMALDGEGRIVAGLGKFDALQVLYATESGVRASVDGEIDLVTRVKNFELP
jgi:hypothetical protein